MSDVLPLGAGQVPFTKFFRDSEGDIEMNNDYSLDPETFSLTPDLDDIVVLRIVKIAILDSNVSPSDFGGIANGLANGFQFTMFKEGRVITDFTDGELIKTNHGLGNLTNINSLTTVGTMISLFFNVDLSLFGFPVVLDQSKNSKIQVTFNDDLSSITAFSMVGVGYKANRRYI